ncbi:MAG TPA: S-methyl-5-thioribose-1-phosphate isomerase [Pirellulales bacterium]|nr:S-methyl-5-thioribose-1-phosphate isomerase [Pirellulales bacterium]
MNDPALHASGLPDSHVPALRWQGDIDGHLLLLDQTLLPIETREIACRDVATVWEAIRALRVRGAPAIGLAAAYGLCLAAQQARDKSPVELVAAVGQAARYLATSRPTAVNLFWALERMERHLAQAARDAATMPSPAGTQALRVAMLAEAQAMYEEDRRGCRRIGQIGAEFLRGVEGVLTHCNAGGLVAAEYGTALALIFAAHEKGQRLHVFVDETRPLWQGARLTAWELRKRGIEATLICDSMAAHVMHSGRVQAVVVGADRIAANGDAANKIGTYGVAVLARAHGIPLYVAAPASTFDLTLATGAKIPIEERDPREITHPLGKQIAPEGIGVYNPAFDVTPAQLITAIITERGAIQPVDRETVAAVLNSTAP